MLVADALLTLSRDVITRNDPAGLLLFQVRTDEMHFVPRAAEHLLSLVDGSRTIAEIEEELCIQDAGSDAAPARPAIREFLEKLVARQIVEVWS